MSSARWCGRCGGVLKPEIVHDAVKPAHSDGNYIEVNWVCPKCGHVAGVELGRT